jgi:glycosyltransferase involved in cell wall biosynthesis
MPFASLESVPIPSPIPPRWSPAWWGLRLKSMRHPAAAWYRRDVARRFRALVARVKPEAIVYGMSWVLPYAKHAPGIPAIADEHNYDPQIAGRMIRGGGFGALKWRAYTAITAAAERRNLAAMRGIAACSPDDAAIFRREAPHADVELVPNGVDTASFAPSPPGGDVVMTGSFAYAPNIDGARRLVRRIWPLVREKIPTAQLRLVGLHSEATLRDLASQPGVTVVGTVPDIQPELARACVAVAPIHIGGGTRIKILEAFAASRAVVSTTVGAEGLSATDGDTILLRDDDRGFADAIVRLLHDRALATSMGARARDLAVSQYDWSLSALRFEALLNRVAG